MAFKKMQNLNILIVRNARFSTGPKHLPNSLRVPDWKGYPDPSFPYDFCPKELAILRMPESPLKPDPPVKACTMFYLSKIMFYYEAETLEADVRHTLGRHF